ncbi:MAG: hypothetical protein IJU76_00180 [Desulfovibrionaceae bacterium]|nr:hypothetical protein [Desulfovibrionaceae bacterium]
MQQNFKRKHICYSHFHVVGSGTTPLRCAQILNEMGLPCVFWETFNGVPSFSQRRAQMLHISYQTYNESALLNTILSCAQKTLIFSVNNPYLFPARLVESSLVTVINYHNSLLPRHRGVHAEAWTLFENDTETGITWHIVDIGIDTGNILIQQTIPLDCTMTSIALLRVQAQLAVSTLRDILPDILTGHVFGVPQEMDASRAHLRREIPNNGELSPTWDTEKAWCFLRAMDYGVLQTLGIPFVRCEGIFYGWRTYEHLGVPAKNSEIMRVGNNICVNGNIILRDIFVYKHR